MRHMISDCVPRRSVRLPNSFVDDAFNQTEAATPSNPPAPTEVAMRPRLLDATRMAALRLLVLMAGPVTALGQGLAKASRPEEVGLSSDRLKRLTAAFQAQVE